MFSDRENYQLPVLMENVSCADNNYIERPMKVSSKGISEGNSGSGNLPAAAKDWCFD